MKIKELCNDEKPREKLLEKGASALSNPELLAILIRTGDAGMNAIEMGRRLLLDNGDNLTELSCVTPEKMMESCGIGPGKAASIAAAFELGRRFIAEKGKGKVQISGPKKIYEIMKPVFKGLQHEECWVVYLNKNNLILGKEQISSGGMDSTTFDPRVILRKVLEKKATGIILLHNHPSGNPTPGKSDLIATARLKKALETFDISLTDHIVMADNRFYSFAEEEEFSV